MKFLEIIATDLTIIINLQQTSTITCKDNILTIKNLDETYEILCKQNASSLSIVEFLLNQMNVNVHSIEVVSVKKIKEDKNV